MACNQCNVKVLITSKPLGTNLRRHIMPSAKFILFLLFIVGDWLTDEGDQDE